MKNRVLLSTTSMTPAERQMGRFMRAPDGHDSDDSGVGNAGDNNSQDSNDDDDNRGVNSGDSSTNEDDKNNSGQSDDYTGFWDKQAEGNTSSDDSDDEGKQVGARLAQIIDSANFGNGVFNKEILEQIASGDVDGINKAIIESNRAVIKQTIPVFGELLQAVVGRMQRDFDARLQSVLQSDKANRKLEDMFPEAKDPTVRPIVDSVYKQALVNCNNDPEKAITQTKGMLKAFGVKTGLTIPPTDPNGGSGSGRNRLVDELLGRD